MTKGKSYILVFDSIFSKTSKACLLMVEENVSQAKNLTRAESARVVTSVSADLAGLLCQSARATIKNFKKRD